MRKKVALALSSGGARGYAHIGVIEVLEKEGYEIISIAGSSMGAVVGGMYAYGKLEEYTDWVKSIEKIDIIKLLSLSFNRKGFFKEDKIINTLKEIVGEAKIEDFRIKFTAVAVEIISGKEVWFNKGFFFDAIKASTAIPGVFTPLVKDGKIYVDGGVLNPLPVAPVLNDPADFIVAVDVNAEPKGKYIASQSQQEINLVDIIARAVYLMQGKITRYHIATYSPDLIIEIPRDACNIFDFHRAEEMIELGKRAAESALKNFSPF